MMVVYNNLETISSGGQGANDTRRGVAANGHGCGALFSWVISI